MQVLVCPWCLPRDRLVLFNGPATAVAFPCPKHIDDALRFVEEHGKRFVFPHLPGATNAPIDPSEVH